MSTTSNYERAFELSGTVSNILESIRNEEGQLSPEREKEIIEMFSIDAGEFVIKQPNLLNNTLLPPNTEV